MNQNGIFGRYLTLKEERQLFRHINQFKSVYARRDHAWMRLARNTGIRVATLAGLTVADARLALASDYLQIRSEIAKRKQAHTVRLTNGAKSALRALLKIRQEMGLALIDDQALICSRKGGALSIRSFQARMKQWVQGAGLPVSASPHWWRHTLSMRIMKQSSASDPRGVVQGVLGHRDINSTALYTQPSREDVELALMEVSR